MDYEKERQEAIEAGQRALDSLYDARDAMARAEEELRHFRRELSDVGQSLRLDSDDFLGFADYFFDGFFVDLLVQSRIKEAQERVADAIVRVESVMDRLTGQ